MGDRPVTSRASFRASLPQATEAIRKASSIAILSHYSPDPDAFGSSCGLALALRASGKTVSIINQDGPVEKLAFIPGANTILASLNGNFDLLIVCDCGDIKRVGESLEDAVKAHPAVINLDHHASNDCFGNIHLLDETASSSAELVLELIEFLTITIDSSIATALLFGMVADTGSFRYSSTSAHTLESAARLVRHGASLHKVCDQLFSQASLTTIRLHAEVLSSLRLLEDSKVCVLVVPPEMVQRLSARSEDSEGLVEKGRDIQGVRVSALIRWVDDLWRISLRSRDPRWDVSVVAKEFGGGGHKAAAAFRWRNSLPELEAKLLPRLCEASRSA